MRPCRMSGGAVVRPRRTPCRKPARRGGICGEKVPEASPFATRAWFSCFPGRTSGYHLAAFQASIWACASVTIVSKPAARISAIICGTDSAGSVVPVMISPR